MLSADAYKASQVAQWLYNTWTEALIAAVGRHGDFVARLEPVEFDPPSERWIVTGWYGTPGDRDGFLSLIGRRRIYAMYRGPVLVQAPFCDYALQAEVFPVFYKSDFPGEVRWLSKTLQELKAIRLPPWTRLDGIRVSRRHLHLGDPQP